ncbi:MAG: DUF6474 family protein [Corynebacterium sp.]|nr:DUF6474 family protein [Corynebacterium sp.]
MGLLKSIRKARVEAKAKIKAAEAKARQEAKEASKLEFKRDKLLAKQEKRLLKEEKKGLKAQRKHEEKLAENALEQLKAGSFNAASVKRYIGASRALAIFALPLAYRGKVQVQRALDQRRASRLGVSSDDLARYAGHGATERARIAGLRNVLDEELLPKSFIQDCEARLDTLESAVDTAEHMTRDLRVRSLRSVNNDLDMLGQEIQQRQQA